ncbi:hypothetical protein Kpol_507p7 [Vanderwaltozyma polyspora DSM 70294]|uniref:Coatomer subunit delta n=1 Tax=Vanderwaltozyma polyspora (strain ATCC 22028 / DSM 70294 / BCRC 21397 / CBS 2163 / NBRC 10782 / NRRL Y-8283 / UCD 57-17) TaxID=436907 RepID=A7TPF9_VANPO|nr:uncharacterized protein Kpol_507p7 [Vanderwaltozyma polyspora DSM 70294]EDO15845.1 hypothetical protein Kpol_507p7 [Vanderwaltozyma polyspora DSM 70294]
MTVLSAAIMTRGGKPLLSRQFKELTKERVIELLSNFQGLVSKSSSDHTYVEDEHVRYVYRPFDDYYLILVTNRQSNIIQDLSTLNLFSQSVNYYLNSFDEEEIFINAFEILSSFDEIIVMGNKENLTVSQVNTYLAMESHEERIQEIIEQNKEAEANAERKRRAKEIARREQERKLGIPSYEGEMAGHKFMGSNDPNMANAYNSYYSQASVAAQKSYLNSQQTTGLNAESKYAQIHRGNGGMKLQSNPRGAGLQSFPRSNVERPSRSEPEEIKPENNGILISIKETINAEISRDGAVRSTELKGVMELRINDESLAHSKVTLSDSVNVSDKSLQFKTHPNIDKKLFLSSKTLGLRSSDKAFPSNDQSLGILRWRKTGSTDDKSLLPLEVSTWVSPSDDSEGVFEVTVEFELNSDYNDKELEDVIFKIPVATNNAFINDDNNEVNATIIGTDEEGVLIKLDSVTPESSGVFSFSIDCGYEDALFPIAVSFKHTSSNVQSIVGISVADVISSSDESGHLPYDSITSLVSEEYVIV